jgi:phospholipase/carboxylesterase
MDCRLLGKEKERLMNLLHSLYEPAGRRPHPTVLALHGWGASAMDLLSLAPNLGLGQFMVICPQGEVEVSRGGFPPGYGWFDLESQGGLNLAPRIEEIMAALSRLTEFFDEALKRYPIDPKRLVVLGFSQGGAMAYGLGLGTPSRFKGLAALSSWLEPELAKKVIHSVGYEGLRALVHHGLHDPLVDVSKARESVDILRSIKIRLTYQEYDMGHEISDQSLVDLTRWLEETLQ